MSTCCICLEELPILNSVGNDGDSSAETSRKRKRSIDINCGHRFHSDCIQKWINTLEGNGLCPICREDIAVGENSESLGPRPMLTAWRRIRHMSEEILDDEFADEVFWGDEDNSEYENFWDSSNEYFGDEVSENYYSVHRFNFWNQNFQNNLNNNPNNDFDFEIGSNNLSDDEDDSHEENIRDNSVYNSYAEAGSDNENGDNSPSEDTVSLAGSLDDEDISDNSVENFDGHGNSDNNWDESLGIEESEQDSDEVVILEQAFEDNSENGDSYIQETNSSSDDTFTLTDSSDDEDIWDCELENNSTENSDDEEEYSFG